MSRRVQAKGHAQHSLCAEPWSRFAGPGSWAGMRTWRLGSGARLGSLCRSRDEQRLFNGAHPHLFILPTSWARPRRTSCPLGGPGNQVVLARTMRSF
jgi:hypothetical protein